LRLVVGLGNPGRQYARTRHNAGFMVVDALAERWGIGDAWKTKGDRRELVDRARGVVLLEPLSYMNLSGEPAEKVASWYKIEPSHMLVVVDELDLPFGTLRMRERGSAGGHNGLKSMIQYFGPDFPRLRVGIGRDSSADAIDRVLGTFGPDEERQLPDIITAAVDGVELWLKEPVIKAINFINSWSPAS
jgi:PTH1 family peptidyl-tRNA hydrolase